MSRILIACEESQRVCSEFRKFGHEAYSCDLIPTTGEHPEWHIQDDVLKHLEDGWDAMIAFPPCTYLTVAGNRWFDEEKYGEKAKIRKAYREFAIEFFIALWNAPIDYIAIENPVGIMSTRFRPPDIYIQPYEFGDPERKKTGLWLKNLPILTPTNIVKPRIIRGKDGKWVDSAWHRETWNLSPEKRRIARSKTFPGIAKAMAEQWSYIIENNIKLNKQLELFTGGVNGDGIE